MTILIVYLAIGFVAALVMTERKYPGQPPFGLKLLAVAVITLTWFPLWLGGALTAVAHE